MINEIDVSVIIVNFNTLKLTSDCIKSIMQHNQKLSIEIILVDNGSTQPGIEQIKTAYPDIQLIKSKTNLGFAGGNNLGIHSAKGKYILLLNSDTYLQDDAIFIIHEYMERHISAGIVSAKLIFPDGKIQCAAQRFPSIKYSLIELFRIQKILPKRIAGKILLGAFFDHNENTTADWVWGAFFMFRKEILKKLPGNKLNDRYFMYCEDMQWCWDTKKMGYEIHYCADATVVHVMGGSSGPKNEQMGKNHDDFMKRNYPGWYLFVFNNLAKLLSSNT